MTTFSLLFLPVIDKVLHNSTLLKNLLHLQWFATEDLFRSLFLSLIVHIIMRLIMTKPVFMLVAKNKSGV